MTMIDRPGVTEDPASADLPRIVHSDDSLIVAYKPHRLHSAPLGGRGGESLAAWLFGIHPEIGPLAFGGEGPSLPPGRDPAEAGLLHRLDFETAGLLLFARSPSVLAVLLAAQEAGTLVKTYRLVAARGGGGLPGSRPLSSLPAGIPEDEWEELLSSPGDLAPRLAGTFVESRFRSYGPRGARVACLGLEAPIRPPRRGSPEDSYRTGILEARTLPDRAGEDPALELRVRLTRGFRHQVRAHLAWLRLPLLGDALYGGRPADRLHLVAEGLEFAHPATGLPFALLLPSRRGDCQDGIPDVG